MQYKQQYSREMQMAQQTSYREIGMQRHVYALYALLLVFVFTISACDMGTTSEAQDGTSNVAETTISDEVANTEVEAETSDVTTDTQLMTRTVEVTDTASMTGLGATSNEVSAADNTQAWILAYELIGQSFTNVDGEISGNVQDLIIDLRTGAILLAEIEYGGFLDIGDREILVPLTALRTSDTGEEITLAFDEQLLENYPDLESGSPRLNDPAWYEGITAFWNDVLTTDDSSSMATIDSSTVDVTSDPIVRATDLLGFSLVDLGSGVGTIQNMLVNRRESQGYYLMVSYGTGTADDAPFLIPFSAVDIVNIDTTEITLDAGLSMETLQLAPRFDRFLFEGANVVGGQTAIDDAYVQDVNTFWEEQGLSISQ